MDRGVFHCAGSRAANDLGELHRRFLEWNPIRKWLDSHDAAVGCLRTKWTAVSVAKKALRTHVGSDRGCLNPRDVPPGFRSRPRDFGRAVVAGGRRSAQGDSCRFVFLPAMTAPPFENAASLLVRVGKGDRRRLRSPGKGGWPRGIAGPVQGDGESVQDCEFTGSAPAHFVRGA